MKNTLILALIFTFLLISCDSDEKDDDKNSLNGSVWKFEDFSELRFISNNECHLFMDFPGLDENDYYEYKFNDSDIDICYKGSYLVKYKLEFQSNGNLAIIDERNLYLFEFTKQ